MNTINNTEFDKIMNMIRNEGLSTEPELVKDRISVMKHEDRQTRWKKFKWHLNPINLIKLAWRTTRSCVRKTRNYISTSFSNYRIRLIKDKLMRGIRDSRLYRDKETKEVIELLGLCGEARGTGNCDKYLVGAPSVPFYMRPDYSRKKDGKYFGLQTAPPVFKPKKPLCQAALDAILVSDVTSLSDKLAGDSGKGP